MRKHPRLQGVVSGPGHVRHGQGPKSVADRGAESEAYNGEGGGHVFRWYMPNVYARALAARGVDYDSCTEADCMAALRATTRELERYPLQQGDLTPFAGPQCFPQHGDRARVLANGQPAQARGGAEEGAPEEEACADKFEQLRSCWLRCDRCRKWRLVEQASMPAVDPDAFVQGVAGEGEDVWGAYLAEAPARYSAFLARRGLRREQESGPDGGAEEGGGAEHAEDGIGVYLDGAFIARPVFMRVSYWFRSLKLD